jgi:hypothetical protein
MDKLVRLMKSFIAKASACPYPVTGHFSAAIILAWWVKHPLNR